MATWRRPPGRPRNVWLNKVQEDASTLPLAIRCGDLTSPSPGVTERRNGPLGLRDDDDDDDDSLAVIQLYPRQQQSSHRHGNPSLTHVMEHL